MNKHKIFIPILIVILISLLILFYSVLFKRGKQETIGESGGQLNLVTPPIEADYDELFIKEFNEAEKRVDYQYTLSTGETITVKIPEGIEGPPQEAVERMWRKR